MRTTAASGAVTGDPRLRPAVRSRTFAVVVALALGVAGTGALGACSSSEPSSQAATTTTIDLAQQARDLNEASRAASELDDALGGGGCIQTSLAYASLMSEPLSMLGGTASKDQIEQFKRDTAELQARIPAEVRDQFAVISAAFTGYAETFSSIDFSNPDAYLDPGVQQRLEEASNRLDAPEVKAARADVDAYFARICPSAAAIGGPGATVPTR